MFGQGRPPRRSRPDTPGSTTNRLASRLWAAALAFCAVAAGLGEKSPARAGEPLDVRIRIAWGGGEARAWQGAIRVTEGTLSEATPLGLEADTPGSMLPLDAAAIRIVGRSPRSYDGCDLRVQAPSEAKLLVQLWDEGGGSPAPLEIELARVIHDFTQLELDDRKNRLFAQRSPGDGLRVTFSQTALIFAPGEKFPLEVQPLHLPLAANTSYQLEASLCPARTDDNVWTEVREIRTPASGSAAATALSVPLPEQEGVYDLRLSLAPTSLLPKRLTTPLVRGKPIATRKVQLVVVSPVKHVAPPAVPWQSVLDFDPATPKWWERMARLPSWARLPAVPRHIESGATAVRNHLGKAWVELGPGAWQAYPLSIANPGLPHLLEVEYPSDLSQTLAISLVEPNAAGYVGPIGLDSGIDVPPPAPGHKPAVQRHRLVCWPQTRTPYVLLVNRREDTAAVFGKIDVQAGPVALPALPLTPITYSGRLLAGYYDKPLFTENFSATEAVDPVSRKGLDDWLTFSAGAERLLDTLQQGGYNSVMLTVACDGSAIYPSKLLEPTPRYDSGVFFESGQDPVRKDVLELLFRLCDRRGVVLIPALHLTSPLVELEAIRLAGGSEAEGLEPVGADGLTSLERSGPSGSAVYYNALDERVQHAETAVVAELAERYGHHASFGGVGVHLSGDGYAVLPDKTCSLDDVTFARFLADANASLPPSSDPPLVARWSYITGGGSQKWLDWRADKLAAMYRQMRGEITQRRPGAKLYLTTAHLLGARQWQATLRPELPTKNGVAEMLPQVGVLLDRLVDDGIVMPRPQRIVPATTPQSRDQEQHWNRHAALDSLWARPAQRAAQHLLAPAPLRLMEFDAASPFGADKTRLLLISQLVPADASQRERFVNSLARLDASLLIDGGWLLPLGQEPRLAPLVKVYRRLPEEPFETVTRPAQPQELVLRTLSKGDKTWFYAVNPSPWPLTAQIQFTGPDPIRITSYSDERPASVQTAAGAVTWSVEMEPFDLVGGEASSGRVKATIAAITPPLSVSPTLVEQLSDTKRRANDLSLHPRPVTLENPSFEAPSTSGSIPGWIHAHGGGMMVEVDRTQGSASARSLHLVSRGAASAVWVRSNPLPTPTTGRIQVKARLRIADPAAQPLLRLAIEGKLDGQVYYRRLNVGAREREGDPTPPPLASDWKTYEIALPSLPIAGFTDLRVGFDLMSDGEVWIDDVQVFDLWLQNSEFDELLKSAVTARLQIEKGRLNECRLFTEDYWPSFLRRHVQVPDPRQLAPAPPPPRSNSPPAISAAAPANPPAAPPLPPPQSSDKRKGWLPTWLRWR